MPDATGVEDLAARKQQLVEECEEHRQVLRLEFAELESAVARTLEPVRSIFSVSSAALVVAPLLGFLVGRRRGKSGGWLKTALVGWQMFKRIQPLWARFRQRRDL